jgi:hypothetical protein
VGKVYRREGEELVAAGMGEAERHLSEGFSARKLKVGFGVRSTATRSNSTAAQANSAPIPWGLS